MLNKGFLNSYGLFAAWFLAISGTLVSLFFSEIRHLEPCHICWYQRVALFPLVLFLGLGSYLGERKMAYYTLPFVILGALFASYQILIQAIPGWNPIDMCGAGPSCAEKIDIGLGFVSIPMLSLLNFLAIGALLSGTLVTSKERI